MRWVWWSAASFDILTLVPPFPSLPQHINSYKVGPPGNLIFSLQYQTRSIHTTNNPPTVYFLVKVSLHLRWNVSWPARIMFLWLQVWDCQVCGLLPPRQQNRPVLVITVIPRMLWQGLLWPLNCELRDVSQGYFCQAATVYVCRTTWENYKQPTQNLPPPPQLSTLEPCLSINIFHPSMVYHFYVWNSLQIVCILIFWSDDYNGWKTQSADAGDISPLSTLGRDKLLCNPDLIFFQQFPNLISLSQGAVHEISVYFAESMKYF